MALISVEALHTSLGIASCLKKWKVCKHSSLRFQQSGTHAKSWMHLICTPVFSAGEGANITSEMMFGNTWRHFWLS
jgi:hypothetical protein